MRQHSLQVDGYYATWRSRRLPGSGADLEASTEYKRVIVKSGVLPIDSSGGLIDVAHFDSIVEFHSINHLGQIIESARQLSNDEGNQHLCTSSEVIGWSDPFDEVWRHSPIGYKVMEGKSSAFRITDDRNIVNNRD